MTINDSAKEHGKDASGKEQGGKEQGALLTIGELADQLGLPTHILRYWETRFSALKPLTRTGNRRYYRPGDVALAHRINSLLNEHGFTIKGAQKALLVNDGVGDAGESRPAPAPAPAPASPTAPISATPALATPLNNLAMGELKQIRDKLARALLESRR